MFIYSDRFLTKRSKTLVVAIFALAITSAQSQIQVNWMRDGNSFWYSENQHGQTKFYKVNPQKNIKTELLNFNQFKDLFKEAEGLILNDFPFDHFKFIDANETKISFTAFDTNYNLDLNDYALSRGTLKKSHDSTILPKVIKTWKWSWPDLKEQKSPDGKWLLGLDNYNVVVRSTQDGRLIQLTSNGEQTKEWLFGWEDNACSGTWSPDNSMVALVQDDIKNIPFTPIPYVLGDSIEIGWLKASKPGSSLAKRSVFISHIYNNKLIKANLNYPNYPKITIVGWAPDSSEIWILVEARYSDTGGPTKRKKLVAVNADTGNTRTVLEESDRSQFIAFINHGEEFIWASERNGWYNLFLFDSNGLLINKITNNDFPLLIGPHGWIPQNPIIFIDEAFETVYYMAQGDKSRPYDSHFYKCQFNGRETIQLTDEPGWHEIQLSPSKSFFVDTYSNALEPPITKLKSIEGKTIAILSKSEKDYTNNNEYVIREKFKVKAADGQTDLYGVLYKPPGFEVTKEYPVIEWIYAGPWTTIAPRKYNDYSSIEAQHFARLGAITFVVDGRGTPGRGKAFEDEILGNLGLIEIPDHLAVLRQLASSRPYMNLKKVGIIGGSWGGYFTLRAMLLAPDVYKVGVSLKPANDLADYFASYVEPYLGAPEKNQDGYNYGSNALKTKELEGKLLIIHGTGDAEAPFSGTLKLLDAFYGYGKQVDLMVVPDADHYPLQGKHGVFLRKSIDEYFKKHLGLD